MTQQIQTITLANLKIPKILKDIVQTINPLYPSICNNRLILNILLTKIFQMFSLKRIKLDESGRIKPINWFSILFFSSGGGKDRLVEDMDNFVFKYSQEWFKKEAQKAFDNNNNKIYDLKLVNEIQDATPEGILALAKIMKEIKFGSIFIKISEFGLYIKNSNNRMKLFLSMLNQLYSCIVPNKIIKSELFSEEIQDIPVTVLAYSDYTLFVNEIRSYFNKILNTGYARRFMFSFQELKELRFKPLSDTEEREIYKSLENLGLKLFEIFLNIEFNSCFKLTPSAKTLLNNYKSKICELYNCEPDSILQKEINSQELKALKLSCLFACINHNKILEIQEDDISQAIDTVEFLSQDFKKFLHFKPQIDDKYNKAYKFLRENEGREFTKTQLMQVFTSQFGFSREPLRRNFDEVMSAIFEIAQLDGYTIIYYNNKYKHGTSFNLVKNEFAIATTNDQGTMHPTTRYPF